MASTATFAVSEGSVETIGAAALLLAITFAAFVWASTVFWFLGEAVLRLASRIVGIILFAIAVDFVLDRLETVFEA